MTARAILALCLGVLTMAAPTASSSTEPAAGHVTGIGGVFFKARDPKALAAWYADVLGMPVKPWGGAVLRPEASSQPTAQAWNPFPASTTHFAPSAADLMVNYTVDDMDAIVARLEAKGVAILKREDGDYGRFAWVLDPEGNKVELWQPKRP